MDPADLTRTMTRYATGDRERLEAQMNRDKYENHAELGFVAVGWRFIKDHPELRLPYVFVFLGCLGGGELPNDTSLLVACC